MDIKCKAIRNDRSAKWAVKFLKDTTITEGLYLTWEMVYSYIPSEVGHFTSEIPSGSHEFFEVFKVTKEASFIKDQWYTRADFSKMLGIIRIETKLVEV